MRVGGHAREMCLMLRGGSDSGFIAFWERYDGTRDWKEAILRPR